MVKTITAKHEAGCTLNPARVCGICNLLGNEQKPMAALKEALAASNDKLDVLRELCDNCPMCILAAIRQHNKGVDHEDQIWPEFDCKAELTSFWDDYRQREHYAYG